MYGLQIFPNPKGMSDEEIYSRVPSYPVGVLDFMPPDFLARTKWRDPEKTTADDCVTFLYGDGKDPHDMVLSQSYPTYKGLPGKRVVIFCDANLQHIIQDIQDREVNMTCGDRFCVNRRHMKLGNRIKNYRDRSAGLRRLGPPDIGGVLRAKED